ncbi:MAG: DsbC family protein, partial [Gammaproteobacteria bacterium]
MNKRTVALLFFGLSMIFSSLPGLADEKQVLNALHDLFPDRQPDHVNHERIPGWHEAVYGTQVFYVSDDGRFVMQGDIYDLKHQKNLTEEIRIAQRKQILETLDDEHLIVFKPKKTLYHLVVFSDIDCGYCRKLHSEIQNYLDQGIEIRYVLFPRTGEYTSSYYKAVSVWCSDDRQ